MEHEKNIDLYLVSGFLGSGKTTFIQNLLMGEQDHGKIGVIVNEFGSIGIDGKLIQDGETKLVEINNGSIFCACLKDGFVKTLAAFLQQPIERLYVEASGMADPSSIEQLLREMEPLVLKKYTTDRRYNYKGCICIVDCGHFIDLSESLLPPVMQVKKSNLVVLNKVDTVTVEGKKQVLDAVLEINPEVKTYFTTFAKVPAEVITKALCGEVAVEEETSNKPWNRPFGGILTMKGTYEYLAMVKFFQDISAKMYRVKGFFSTSNGSYYVSGVGKNVTFSKVEKEEDVNYQVVLIANQEESLTDWLKEIWTGYIPGPFDFREE